MRSSQETAVSATAAHIIIYRIFFIFSIISELEPQCKAVIEIRDISARRPSYACPSLNIWTLPSGHMGARASAYGGLRLSIWTLASRHMHGCGAGGLRSTLADGFEVAVGAVRGKLRLGEGHGGMEYLLEQLAQAGAELLVVRAEVAHLDFLLVGFAHEDDR